MRRFVSAALILIILLVSGCSAGSKTDNNGSKDAVKSVTQSEVSKAPENKAEPAKKASGVKTQKETPSPTKAPDTQKAAQTPSSKKNSSFTLSITENKGSKTVLNKKVDIISKKSLMEYLKENAAVIDDGGFIKSINNINSISANKLTAEQKKAGVLGVDWFIYVNGRKTSVGAYDIYPKSNDLINLDYKEWTYQDYGP